MHYAFNGKNASFATHKLVWQEAVKKYNSETNEFSTEVVDREMFYFTATQCNQKVAELKRRKIIAIVHDVEAPTAELLQSLRNKTFKSYDELCAFIESGVEPNRNKTELEILQETVDALLLASLEV